MNWHLGKGIKIPTTPAVVGYEVPGRSRFIEICEAEEGADGRSLEEVGDSFGYCVRLG